MRWSALQKNNKGEIQGMVLVIIIMVIVAVVVLGIIIGWLAFFNGDPVKKLNIDDSSLPNVKANDNTFSVTVIDANKNEVTDAKVYANGCGLANAFANHTGNGVYRFTAPSGGFKLYGDATGTITVTAEKSGWESDSVNIVVTAS